MNEDALNMQVRKFLKKVGINSQREIENAIRTANQNGNLDGKSAIQATMTLKIDELDVNIDISDSIKLD